MIFDEETDTNSDHYRPVLVEWMDSAVDDNAWRSLTELLAWAKDAVGACVRVRTVGYLLHEDTDAVTIVQSVSRFQGNGTIAIPRSCITKMEFLA